MAEKKGIKQIAVNRQARHEYFVEETMEAGIELFGTEPAKRRPQPQGQLVQLRKRGAVRAADAHQPLRKGQHLQP